MLAEFLNKYQKESDSIYRTNDTDGYWSNLSKKQNAELMGLLGKMPVRECIKATFPFFTEVIFSEKRAAGIELLKLKGNETAVDLGCMWGGLTIPLAKQAGEVLGIDQTIESLKFTATRAKEDQLSNVNFLCGNLRKVELPKNTFDVAIVNGVLEWIPELEPVVVAEYLDTQKNRHSEGNPGELQEKFLKNVFAGLKQDGRLMLAIENRYDYKMFFGVKDPHAGLMFTTIFPRFLANLISLIFRKRPYRPWIYSATELTDFLHRIGFKKVSLYSCWPDYRFPDHITPYGVKSPSFVPTSARINGKLTLKRVVANRVEWLLFKIFNFQFFAPSFIAVAEK